MKKRQPKISLHISEPCSENWDKMTPETGGRHCDTCSRTIMDFTSFSDAELARYHQKNRGGLCGRFRVDQLDHPIALPTVPTSWERWRAAGILASGLLLSQGAVGQSTEPLIPPMPAMEQNICGQPHHENAPLNPNAKPLTGLVTDTSGMPLIGASLMVVGSFQGTVTDIDGRYQLDRTHLPDSFAITVSYTGYETQTVAIDAGKLTMKNFSLTVEVTLKEAVVIGYRTIKCKSITMGMVSVGDQSPEATTTSVSADPVNPESEIPSVILYPNPFISTFQLNWESTETGKWTVNLIDDQGRVLLQEQHNLMTGFQKLVIDAGHLQLPGGSYYVRLESGQGEIYTLPIVKGK
ncbi:MAG: hypothetical protein DHS20C18_04530 [Saprospiraceae bacterium]|nr:MAG: hypothetical protein DHS20C18_04530 [Saprospiraceae bacterium]